MDSALEMSPAASASIAGTVPGGAMNPSAARKAAEDFESFYLSQSFESMLSGVGSDQLFGGGNGETVYRSLLVQEYSKVAAQHGGVGIADAVQREILRMQEHK